MGKKRSRHDIYLDLFAREDESFAAHFREKDEIFAFKAILGSVFCMGVVSFAVLHFLPALWFLLIPLDLIVLVGAFVLRIDHQDSMEKSMNAWCKSRPRMNGIPAEAEAIFIRQTLEKSLPQARQADLRRRL
jgi:hypothetical protein